MHIGLAQSRLSLTRRPLKRRAYTEKSDAENDPEFLLSAVFKMLRQHCNSHGETQTQYRLDYEKDARSIFYR